MTNLIHKNHTFAMDNRIEIPAEDCLARWEENEDQNYKDLIVTIPALGPLAEQAKMNMRDFEGSTLKIQVTHKAGKFLPPVDDFIVGKYDDVKTETENGYEFKVRVKKASAGPDVLVNVSLVNPTTRLRLMSAEHIPVLGEDVVEKQSVNSILLVMVDNGLKTNYRVDAKVDMAPTVYLGATKNGFLGKAFLAENPAMRSVVIREVLRLTCNLIMDVDVDNDGVFEERSTWMQKWWKIMVKTAPALTSQYSDSFVDGVDSSIAKNVEEKISWTNDMIETFEIKNGLHKDLLKLLNEA